MPVRAICLKAGEVTGQRGGAAPTVEKGPPSGCAEVVGMAPTNVIGGGVGFIGE